MRQIITIILIFFFVSIKADPLKPLPIDFFDENPKKQQANYTKKTIGKKPGDKKKYEKMIKGLDQQLDITIQSISVNEVPYVEED